MIHHGDCLEVMAAMEPESVDAIVTDPPYGLEFMGKGWDGADGFRRSLNRNDVNRDNVFGRTSNRAPEYRTSPLYQQWSEAWAREAHRVAKPSAYLLAFGGTRTVHRMTVALEDAGWIIRDMLVWAYASGFPKSRASLKPAWEPIVMARKPGPLRDLAIDECRIPSEPHDAGRDGETTASTRYTEAGGTNLAAMPGPRGGDPAGRWPSNVILTDTIFDGGVEGVVGGGDAAGSKPFDWTAAAGRASFPVGREASVFYDDSGTYSRFFLIPKADRADREPVLGGQTTTELHLNGAFAVVCAKCNRQRVNVPGAACSCDDPEWVRRSQKPRANVHPTVKPTELMRHLVRLVTPPGGTVLDPFLGSGTTALAAEMEGFPWIGIEREAEYVAIAEARLNGTQRGLGLVDGQQLGTQVPASDPNGEAA